MRTDHQASGGQRRIVLLDTQALQVAGGVLVNPCESRGNHAVQSQHKAGLGDDTIMIDQFGTNDPDFRALGLVEQGFDPVRVDHFAVRAQ
ncbi:hypothetical protein D3C86_1636910 [compost metagenome]